MDMNTQRGLARIGVAGSIFGGSAMRGGRAQRRAMEAKLIAKAKAEEKAARRMTKETGK